MFGIINNHRPIKFKQISTINYKQKDSLINYSQVPNDIKKISIKQEIEHSASATEQMYYKMQYQPLQWSKDMCEMNNKFKYNPIKDHKGYLL